MHDELILKLTEEESNRDEVWIADLIRLLPNSLNPVMSKADYEFGHNVLFGVFPKLAIDNLFQGAIMNAMKDKLSGSTVYFFEKIRNAIIDERINSGLAITLNSLDPEKEEKKRTDRDLLTNRKGVEALINEITQNNGMPPKKFGKDDFHGNIEEFDEAGYDDMDADNVKDFFDAKWGLKSEMDLQEVVNKVVRTNQVTRKFDKYINDILISNTTCSQVYVDEIEGKIKIDHLYPYEVEVFAGTGENDEKGAQGFRIQRTTNIRGLLRRFGSAFSFEDNWQDLLRTVSIGRPTAYKGIHHRGQIIAGEGMVSECVNVYTLLETQVTYSYVEIRVINGNTKLTGIDKNGNLIARSLGEKPAEEVDGFEKSTKYKEDTYRVYYLETGAISPKIIKWGKLLMQPVEGTYDEYSGFSILVNRRIGVPMVNVLKPFYHMMQVSFTMFEVLVNDVKPDGWIYNYDSLAKVAEHLQQAKDTPTDIREAIGDVMKQYQGSPNIITVTPTDETDNIIGGDAFGVKRKENGLNKAAEDLMKIMDWCEAKATSYLGTQGIEFAEAQDGFKLTLENRKRTRAATAFIDFILLNHLEDQATIILSYALNIAKFKDIPAYKYLETLVGEKIMTSIGKMKKSPHRHGIVMDTFNNDIQLLELRQMAQRDHEQGRISLEQYTVVTKFDNITRAIFYLAQERKKADKKRQKDAMSAMQQQAALDDAKFQKEMQLEDIRGKWRSAAEDKRSAGFVQAAQINAQSQIAGKQMSEEGQNQRLAAEANNDISKIAESAKQQARQPVPL